MMKVKSFLPRSSGIVNIVVGVNWNEFGQLYTRNRNRLKPERLRKLVFIYHNLRILARMKVTKEDRRREVAASALAVSAFAAAAIAAASGV